jgi:hypothetical protein
MYWSILGASGKSSFDSTMALVVALFFYRGRALDCPRITKTNSAKVWGNIQITLLLLSHNSMTSQPILAAAPNPSSAAQNSDSSSDAAKGARVNNERFIVLVNTWIKLDE